MSAELPLLESIDSDIEFFETSIKESTNIEQLIKLLHELEIRQSEIDEQLYKYQAKKSLDHQSIVRYLEISRVELSATLNHSRSLKNIMQDANGLSYKITERVRMLDTEKSRIKEIKDYVDNVQSLKLQIDKANEAINHENWLEASKSISVIRSLPQKLINDAFVEFKVPSSEISELPVNLLFAWIEKLEEIFVMEFNKAALSKNVERLSYFFQLFPLIGKSQIGLNCYSRFICGIISEQSRLILRNVQNKQDIRPEFYAQILFQLYQTISEIINQHSRIIKQYYGKSILTSVLTAIQTECDLQSNLIFDTYADSKKLDQILAETSQYTYPVLVKEIYNSSISEQESESDSNEFDDSNVISLAEVSQITDELSAMMNHWAMYCKYFVVIWNESTDSTIKVYPKPLVTSTFTAKIHNKIIRYFDQLCTFTIRRTLEKACTIESLSDTLPQLTIGVKYLTLVFKKLENSTNQSLHALIPEDPPISSLVDDMTIALNNILLEVLATGELLTIKNMVSNMKRIILNDFINIIKQRFKSYILRPSSNLLTKSMIQKIHQQSTTASLKSESRSNSPTAVASRSGTPDLSTTGALFMKGISAAISMTIAGDEDDELYGTGHANDITKFVIYLNTLSVFQKYLGKMLEKCVDTARHDNLLILDDREFAHILNANESEGGTNLELEINMDSETMTVRVETLLLNLGLSFDDRANSIIKEQILILFNKVLKLKIIKLINETIREGAYLINGDDFENNMGNFIKNWNSLIVPYVTTLSKENFNKLIKLIVDIVAPSMEEKIWSLERRCNASGAIKLEKDISVIISEFTKFDYSLRGKFVKITQIVMLLCLDNDEEIEDFRDLEWSLVPSERNRARNLRIDRQ